MRHCVSIANFILPALLFVSCISHADGKIEERNISLRLITNLKNIDIFIKPSVQNRQISPISGTYHFKTPELRFHTPKIMGISLKDNIWDIPDFLTIKNGSEVIAVLSCQQIWGLSKNKDGISILELENK
jgi:hypothetical protein